MYNTWRIRSICFKQCFKQRRIRFFMMYNTWRIRSICFKQCFKQRRIWFFMMYNTWRTRSMCFKQRIIWFFMIYNTWQSSPDPPKALPGHPRVHPGLPRALLCLQSSLEPLLEGSSALKYRACTQKQASWNSPGYPADPPDPPDQVAGAAARTLPSTRAGGQDDVS